MHANFSRFIRPGATMLAVTTAGMVAFESGDGATLAVVIVNDSTTAARSYTFDLTALASVGARARRVPNVANRESGVADGDPGAGLELHGQRPRLSITTLVIPLR